MNTRNEKDVSGEKTGTMGTFAGVFTPSILTILGIILFLRLGYVVGSAGLGRALIIITLANVISILTSISISAIATNIKVKGGGDYYLISRTLGPEFGGAIGMVLFLAQSVSIAFYCIGFGEAMTVLLPQSIFTTSRIIAIFAVSLLFIFAWLGADWATRFQYVVMALLVAALFSFFAGGLVRWEMATLVQNWTAPSQGPEFWLIFAIFFPAVTGFTQGVSMSGDLKNPGKSLPMGTFMAVGISILVYFGAALVFAGVLSNEILLKDYGSMKRVARFSVLINAGVVAATPSSAMASFLGAPRILQSLAKDRIFPFLLPFAKGSGPTHNPRRGVILSAAIAWVTSRLMLLLGYLITRSQPWDGAKIRVLAAGYTADTPENLTDLKNNLEEARIQAEPIVVTNADMDKLSEYSADAAVVFLPFRLRGDQITCLIDAPVEEIVSRLPVTALVLAAEDIALDAEPEEGTAGDMAVAMDALADAEKKPLRPRRRRSKLERSQKRPVQNCWNWKIIPGKPKKTWGLN